MASVPQTAMGEVVDFNRYKQAREAGESPGRPKRRKTPGTRGFDDDNTRQLSLGTPSANADADKSDDNDPPEAG
jgi:hypothetical protein